MSRSEPLRLRPASPQRDLASSRQVSDECTDHTYSTTVARGRKTPRRQNYPNLSPTRAPSIAADVALWPAWTKLSVDQLDLDQFDDNGNLVGHFQRGGF